MQINRNELVHCNHLQSLKNIKIPADYTRIAKIGKKLKNTITNQENMARIIKKMQNNET